MNKLEQLTVQRRSTLREALFRMDQGAKGMLLLVNENGKFERTVTDGDLRRLVLHGATLEDTLESLGDRSSHVIEQDMQKREALDLMNRYGINHLPVVNSQGNVVELLDRKEIDTQILLSTPHMGESERHYVEEAFRSNWIAPLGPNVDAFEKEIADQVGAAHAAAVSSGTAALHLGLRILGVGRGDRVFCSSLTFIASANPIIYQGAEPVFIDSDESTWNMSPAALEKAFVTADTEGWMPKAVIVVSLYGQSADMDPLMALCKKYKVPVLEDAAESLGATYKGKASGTFGDIGIYSFNGNKIITTSGGGMLVSNNVEYMERARFLSTQARDAAPHYQHSEIGFNYRMSNILAGVGRGQLQVLKDRVESRRSVFKYYSEALSDCPEIQWMPEPDWSYSTRWLTTCTISPQCDIKRSDLIKELAKKSIEVRPVWKPLHQQPVFSGCRYFSHNNHESVSDRLFERGICLPSGSNMSGEQMSRVVHAIRSLLNKS